MSFTTSSISQRTNAAPNLATSESNSTYVIKNGIISKDGLYPPTTTFPIISTNAELSLLQQAATSAGHPQVNLSPVTVDTFAHWKKLDTFGSMGVAPTYLLEGLEKIFAEQQIPIGLMNKLLALSKSDKLEFIIDDSGSMGPMSGRNEQGQLRWEEAQSRLLKMLNILSYVPTKAITIRFLNRGDIIDLSRNTTTPESFFNQSKIKIDDVFKRAPSGGTPILKTLEKCLAQPGDIGIYLFCDGTPSGGAEEEAAVTKLLKTRLDPKKDPEKNPATLLSCSENVNDTLWMKRTEKAAEFCAEYDDFKTESDEIEKAQGIGFKLNEGTLLIGQLVGAMNPHDFDSFDDPIPLTKWTLDNFFGVLSTPEQYRYYFDEFKRAQQQRPNRTPEDKLWHRTIWENYFHEFSCESTVADSFPVVKELKTAIAACVA